MIWYKNNLKSNNEGWNWKQNSIKKIKTKFDTKIKWNQMIRCKIKEKNQSKK
jgi:hypothetical protein